MPQYSVQHPAVDNTSQAAIQAFVEFVQRGPCSPVEIHISDALATQLKVQSVPIPVALFGTALIDTGASISGIDEAHALALGLIPMSSTSVSTPNGVAMQNLYAVKLEFPGTPLPAVPFLMVTGSQLKNQGIDVLLGRDYLGDKVLIYNGPMRLYTICF